MLEALQKDLEAALNAKKELERQLKGVRRELETMEGEFKHQGSEAEKVWDELQEAHRTILALRQVCSPPLLDCSQGVCSCWPRFH